MEKYRDQNFGNGSVRKSTLEGQHFNQLERLF